MIRFQAQCSIVMGDRFFRPSAGLQSIGQIEVVNRLACTHLDGSSYQTNGILSLALLQTEQSQQMQYVRLIRVSLEQLQVRLMSDIELATAMDFKSFLNLVLHSGFRAFHDS